MSERDRVYLRDMLDAAQEAMGFAEGQDLVRLASDRKLALALVKEIEIVGEAAARVSPDDAVGSRNSMGEDRRHAQPINPCVRRYRFGSGVGGG